MNENIKLLIEKSTKLTQERNEKIKEKLLIFTNYISHFWQKDAGK